MAVATPLNLVARRDESVIFMSAPGAASAKKMQERKIKEGGPTVVNKKKMIMISLSGAG
jgi:hypothetical protein